LSSNIAYNASDYITLAEAQQACFYSDVNCKIAYYDIAKVFISSASAPTVPITAPVGCAFVRYSFTATQTPIQQFEIGSVQTPYEKYGFSMPKLIYDKDEFLLFLPSEICIAVGRTIELYNKQIAWCGNINNYHFQWICNVGRALKRKWSCTGVAGTIGNHALTCNVYDNNMVQVATATTTVKVVSATISVPKKILTIGDSLTNEKPWLSELRTLSGNQIELVGTRGVAPLKHEGRSGWSAATYLTGATYDFESEGVNPFWNPGTGQFDYAYYEANNAVNPDAIQIFLGTNAILLDPTLNAGNIKIIVDKIREASAIIPIYLVFTLYRGDQDGIGNQLSTDGYSAGSGVWKIEADRKVYNLMIKLNELLKSYTKLYFIPISLAHDSEYNFGSVVTPVNPRAINTELMETEATHPQTQGYLQFADIQFSTMAAHYLDA